MIWYNVANDMEIMKFKIFISSVQREFVKERKALAEYVRKGATGASSRCPFSRKSRRRNGRPTACILPKSTSATFTSASSVTHTAMSIPTAFLRPNVSICVRRNVRKCASASIPVNHLLAQGMYLRGYIEHIGSGTGDIIEKCRESGLPPPQWESEDDGLTIILRRATIASQPQMSPQTDNGTQDVGLDVGRWSSTQGD